MSNILAVGDIVEIKCPGGVAYASYAGKHSWLGDAIWVVPQLFPSEPPSIGSVFAIPGYFAFYPLHSAIRQKLLRKVGYAIEAIRPIPVYVRSVVNRDESGNVSSWLITDGQSRVARTDESLSADERQLPIGAIWNHKMLCERIETGSSPA